MQANGTIIETGFTPFVFLDGKGNPYNLDITLDVVAKWIDEGPPPVQIPDSAKPKPEDQPKDFVNPAEDE